LADYQWKPNEIKRENIFNPTTGEENQNVLVGRLDHSLGALPPLQDGTARSINFCKIINPRSKFDFYSQLFTQCDRN